ncbi:MAG: DEAD/DEAH box helicase [Candidatus Hodarchaeales archaeon]|jgi:ATP-dependent Lhr-like helicase
MKVFELLNRRLLAAIQERGFQAPTIIQQKGIPVLLEGQNALLLSGTGTGKTEAAMLPILSRLLEAGHEEGVQVLYITPLRALNRDIIERLQWWCDHLEISIAIRHGDTPPDERRKILRSPPQVLVTTPETLQLLLPSRMRKHLKTVRWVIVDEIHSLADNRRGTQLALGLRRLKRLLQPIAVQIVALSATLGNPQEVAAEFLGEGVVIEDTTSKFPRILLDNAQIEDEDLKLASELIVEPYLAARLRRIKDYIVEHKAVLVFVNRREDAELLGSRLALFPELKDQVAVHHSSLDQDVRRAAEEKLKKGELHCLVTTASLELGIDIGEIDGIVQYLTPRRATTLLQRAGRSGHRTDLISEILVITGGHDATVESLAVAKRALQGRSQLETKELPPALDVLFHHAIGLSLDGMRSIKTAYSLTKTVPCYKDLSEEQFRDVVEHASRRGYLDLTKERLTKTRRGQSFYYQKVSMIDPIVFHAVYDSGSLERIGELADEFWQEYGKPGQVFFLRGLPWKVVRLDGLDVYVEAADLLQGTMTRWDGSFAPLPGPVAEDVGRLRHQVTSFLTNGNEKDFQGIIGEVDMGSIARSTLTKTIGDQVEEKVVVPTHDRILIEKCDEDTFVVHLCWARMANSAIGLLLRDALIEKTGEAPLMRTDDYRIMLITLPEIEPQDIEEILLELAKNADTLRDLLIPQIDLYRTRYIGMRIGQTPGNWIYGTSDEVQKLSKDWKLGLVIQEAVREALAAWNIEWLEQKLGAIVKGDIEIVCRKLTHPSPLSRRFLSKYRYIGSLDLMTGSLEKLSQRRADLCCLKCGFRWSAIIDTLPDPVSCPECIAPRIAALGWRRDQATLIIRQVLDGADPEAFGKESEELWATAQMAGDLVSVHGSYAIMALSVRGVGVSTAYRILSRREYDSRPEAFLERLREAAIQFQRTHHLWESRNQ